MRVLVDVTPAESDGWQVELTWEGSAGEARSRSHAMGRLPAPGLVRPLGQNAAAPDEPHASLAGEDGAELTALVQRAVEDRGPVEDDVVRLGLHLFDSLLGRDAWDAIMGDAEARRGQNRGEVVELALRFAPSADELHAPLWEAMHDRRGFIAAGRLLPVAVTRIVAGSSGETPRRIAAPLRLLFAIGADLSDPAIRPGAEFVGLLQRLEKRGSVVTTSVLERASLGRLERAVTRFRPDAVHFICHGEALVSEGVLRLPPEDDARDGGGTVVQAGADRLLASLAASPNGLPPLVVLSACETGGGAAVSAGTVPLAVRLVRGGIPVVVAMSGRVSDVGCRLFTRQMGETLVEGGCLVTAAARARRTAFLEAAPPTDSVDWALPAVFLAAGVPADFAPVDPAPGLVLQQRIRALKLPQGPVFCGRREFLADLEDLLDPAEPLAVLVAFTDQVGGGIGKDRLLEEFAVRALRGGHLPCLLYGVEQDPPSTPVQLGAALLKAAERMRESYGLPPGTSSDFLAAAYEDWEPVDRGPGGNLARLHERLDELRHGEVSLSPDSVRVNLATDLARLAADLRAREGAPADNGARVLVLLGGVQRFDAAFEALFDGLLTPHGLGTMEEPVPVALTWAVTDGRGDEFTRQRSSGYDWLRFRRLAPFEGDEETLAYQWVLLNPRSDGDKYGRISWVVRVPDGKWLEDYRLYFAGWPGRFMDPFFYAYASKLSPEIVEADDEKLVQQYIEHEGT